MISYEQLKRFGEIISELAMFYGELSEELPDLRVVVDNTRVFSELKKMPGMLIRL